MTQGLLLPCLRGSIGNWVYYATVMTASQVAAHIRPAGAIRESAALEDYLQRDLQKRVEKISNYLLREPAHFFPSMVVGVFGGVPDWYEFDLSSSSIVGEAIGTHEARRLADSVGLLRMTGREEMFAIDGQHRAKAIQRAWEKDEARTPGRRVLAEDQFPIILVAHRDDEEGKKRSRRLFADINKRAVPVSPGDLAIIDEEEVTVIAARRVYATYGPFRGRISLTARANIHAEDTEHITNLLTLVQVNKKLKKLFKKEPRTKQWDEPNIALMTGIATSFYDFLLDAIPTLGGALRHGHPTIGDLRETLRHMAARPVGLVLLAQLYVHFANRHTLLKAKLTRLDLDLGGLHFGRVLWSGGRMEPKNRAFAYDLCLYLFGEPQKDAVDLRREYRRILKDDSAELPAVLG